MQPVTYDFDVVTDAPKVQRRAPEATEQAPQADPEEERRRASPALTEEPRAKMHAAE